MTVERDQDLRTRTGFAVDFVGLHTPLPQATAGIASDIVTVQGAPALHYEHFSLAMSAERRMARWVAWNVDGSRLLEEGVMSRRGLKFRPDPRLSDDQQILDDAYVGNDLDRGHIARRADLLWGEKDEAYRANADSFFFTNITPQMSNFNQSSRRGIWGRLENALLKESGLTGQRISVFGGPVLRREDRDYRSIRVPREFWKILVYKLDRLPRTKAFLLSQSLSDLEADFTLARFRTFEIGVEDLGNRTSLDFGSIARWQKALPEATSGARAPVQRLGDIVW
jgi:endonuclease G